MSERPLKKRSGQPLYESLYHNLKAEILSGRIKENERLPSKRKLSKDLELSVTTVEHAYEQLMKEGYIRAEHGRGFFVNNLGFEKSGLRPANDSHIKRTYQKPQKEKKEYIVDFRENRSTMELFPMATWSKIMRNILTYNEMELMEPVSYRGMYVLREAIAEYLNRAKGMDIDPSLIVIGPGTEYLYNILLNVFTDDIIAMEDPGYRKFTKLGNRQSLSFDYIPVDRFGMRIDRLDRSRANIAHVSPDNQFPTGAVMPITRRTELVRWAARENTHYIIEDGYDSELQYGKGSLPALYSLDKRNKVIYMNTFSKSLVPSIRISYMVLPPLIAERYHDIMKDYSCAVSSFEQLTLAKFISEGYFERHINTLRHHYRKKRDLIIHAAENSSISKISHIEHVEAGTRVLIRIQTDMSDKQIRAEAEVHGINFRLLSDYETINTLKNSRTLVINYAGLTEEKAIKTISILEDIFAEEIKLYSR